MPRTQPFRLASFRQASLVLILGLLPQLGCQPLTEEQPRDVAPTSSRPDPLTIGPAERPATLQPSTRPGPQVLYVLLHGFGSSAADTGQYLNIAATVERRGGHLLLPEGRPDSQGKRYWDATDACCEFEREQSDVDERYLVQLIREAQARVPTEGQGVTLVGYSNGSFMAQRLACRQAELVDRAISFVGAGFSDPQACQPSRAVAMLHIHGEVDPIVRYEGGTIRAPYPAAPATVATWARANGCQGEPVIRPRALELSFEGGEERTEQPPPGLANLPLETDVTEYQGCARPVALLTMRGLGHLPRYREDVIDYLLEFQSK